MLPESNTHSANAPASQHLPLEPLLVMLRRKGFVVVPEDYVQMLKVVERYGTRDLDTLAQLLCPLVASTPQEQTNFYRAMEEYKLLQSDEEQLPVVIEEKKDRRGLRITWWMIALAVAALLAVFLWPGKKKEKVSALIENINSVYRLGDTIYLPPVMIQESGMQNEITTEWLAGTDSLMPVSDSFYVLSVDGPQMVIQRISTSSGNIQIEQATDTAMFFVCDHITDFTISASASRVRLDETFEVTYAFHDAADSGTPLVWTIDGEPWNAADEGYRHSFSTVGSHWVSCQAMNDDEYSPCSPRSAVTINVYDAAADYTLTPVQIGQPLAVPVPHMREWLHYLILLPALLATAFTLLRKKPKPKADPPAVQPPEKALKLKPPFDIPLANDDQLHVVQERPLRNLVRDMKERAESGDLALHIPATIRRIIGNAGLPELVYAPQTARREFLVLIDRSNPKSLMLCLQEYLVRLLENENITITRFYYNADLQCFNSQYPLGVSLNRLSELYGHTTLVMMGTGHQLLYRAMPMVEPLMMEMLRRWQNRTIITPLSPPDWGQKEKVLAEHIRMAPADAIALEQLLPLLRERTDAATRFFVVNEKHWYSAEDFDLEDKDDLQAYLADPLLYQWLCAICVFPRLRWEILITVGKKLLDTARQPELLSYSNLLKLCRIPWMSNGVFPQKTRLQLLKDLEVTNELLARKTVRDMLLESKRMHGDDHFFSEELDLQKTTNEFVLFANDAEQHAEFRESHDKFRQYWHSGMLLDTPAQHYFNKQTADNWETPIRLKNTSVGINDYFFSDFEQAKKRQRRQNWVLRGAAIVLAGIWAAVFFRALPADGRLAQNLYATDSLEMRNFHVWLTADSACNIADAEIRLRTAQGVFTLTQENISTGAGLTQLAATLQTSYAAMGSRAPTFEVSWQGKQATFPFDALPDSAVFKLSCGVNDDPNQTILPEYLSEIWNGPGGLMAINLATRRSYATLNLETDPNIYDIADSYAAPDSSRIIVQQLFNPSGGEGIFFRSTFPSMTPQAITHIFCDRAYDNPIQAIRDRTGCGNPQVMQLYYPRYNNRILVPQNAKDYVISEVNKVKGYIEKAATNTYKTGPNSYSAAATIDATVYVNRFYHADALALERYSAIVASFPNLSNKVRFEWSQADFTGTAFDRDYIVMSIRQQRPIAAVKENADPRGNTGNATATVRPNNPPNGNTTTATTKTNTTKVSCDRVFRTIKETYEVSRAAVYCVDLSYSGLTKVPAELYWFENMRQLNLTGNKISDKDIAYLRTRIPKNCNLILNSPRSDYAPVEQQQQQQQQQQTAAPKATGHVIYIYENAAVATAIDRSFESLFEQNIRNIKGGRVITLSSHYANSKNKRQAEQILKKLKARYDAMVKGTGITVTAVAEQMSGATQQNRVVVNGEGFSAAELEILDLQKQTKAAY